MKKLRDRLFRNGKAFVRNANLYEHGDYGPDMGVLWAAYKTGSFPEMGELNQEEFAETILDIAMGYNYVWMIDDHNKKFRDSYGPIGIVFAAGNSWEIEPHWQPFSWASKRNIIKGVVSFLQMMRYNKDVGIVTIYTHDDENNLFRHVRQYGVLEFACKIPQGDVRGNRYIYYTRGRKKWDSAKPHHPSSEEQVRQISTLANDSPQEEVANSEEDD